MIRPCITVALLSIGWIGACTGEFVREDGLGGGAGETAGADAGYPEADAQPVQNVVARQYFEAFVQPLLLGVRPKGACALCHQGTNTTNGPIFMGKDQSENYLAIISNTSLVGAAPGTSSLLTKGDHAGNSFCSGTGVPYNQCDEDEFAILSEWVRLLSQ